MPAPAGHVHVSEREGAHVQPDGQWDNASWEDCLWVGGVEQARLCHDRKIEALHLEAELLRDASGEPPTGGSNTFNLEAGFTERYGWREGPGSAGYQRVSGFVALRAALTPGRCANVAGSFRLFPAGHRLRRWDPSYVLGHNVLLICLLDGTLWWCDGLAPSTGSYSGEPVTWEEVKTYVAGWDGQHIVATLLEAQMDQAPISTTAPVLMDVPGGGKAQLLELDAKTVIKTLQNEYKDQVSPYGVGRGRPLYELRAWIVTISGVQRLALVRGAVNRRPISTSIPTPAPTTGITQQQLDAAKAAGITEGKATEKSRLRQLLGL
jgi:hypothetical protein